MTAADTLKRLLRNRPAFNPEAQRQAFETSALRYLGDLFRTTTRLLRNRGEAEDVPERTCGLGGEETNQGLEQTLRYTPPIPEELRDEDILTALDAIPSDFRAVVLLANVQEFSCREIAGILGVPIGTVMSRLSRGRELLRTELGDLAHSYAINKAQDESVSRAQQDREE